MRRLGVLALATGLVAVGAGPAFAQAPERAAWFSALSAGPLALPAPTAAEGDLRVAGTGARPTAYATLLLGSPAGELVLAVRPDSVLGTPELSACPTTTPTWEPGGNQPFDDGPGYDCAAGSAFGSLAADGLSVSFPLDGLTSSAGPLSVALVPLTEGTTPFSVDLGDPAFTPSEADAAPSPPAAAPEPDVPPAPGGTGGTATAAPPALPSGDLGEPAASRPTSPPAPPRRRSCPRRTRTSPRPCRHPPSTHPSRPTRCFPPRPSPPAAPATTAARGCSPCWPSSASAPRRLRGRAAAAGAAAARRPVPRPDTWRRRCPRAAGGRPHHLPDPRHRPLLPRPDPSPQEPSVTAVLPREAGSVPSTLLDPPDQPPAAPDPVVVDGRTLRAQRTRDAVVAALLALQEEGDLQPTAQRVAARAGVALRTVYGHFSDMESLWLEGGRRELAKISALADVPSADLPFEERLDRFCASRALVLEALLPVMRATRLRRPYSAQLDRNWKLYVSIGDAEIGAVFATELDPLDPAVRTTLLHDLYLVASSPAWDALRDDRRLDPAQAEAVLRTGVRRLLAGVAPSPSRTPAAAQGPR